MVLLLAVAMPLVARDAKAKENETEVAADNEENGLGSRAPYTGIDTTEANETPKPAGSLSPWIALAVVSLTGSALVFIAEKRRDNDPNHEANSVF